MTDTNMNTTYESYQCESDNRGPNETILTTPDGKVSIRIDIDDLVRNMIENQPDEKVERAIQIWDELICLIDSE